MYDRCFLYLVFTMFLQIDFIVLCSSAVDVQRFFSVSDRFKAQQINT